MNHKFCLYADRCDNAPCYTIPMRKYSYLKDFLQGHSKNKTEKKYSIALRVECIKLELDHFRIESPKCINCMFCVFGCTGNRILVNSNIHPTKMCVDITKSELSELQEHLLPRLFNGNFIKLPQVPFSQIKVTYKSFEEFTGTRETENIAVWCANAMKFLSSSLEPRVALEVGLVISERNRGGRLDVALYNTRDQFLFVAETKISFEAMMSEQRYESQMLAYETELTRECPDYLKRCKFLVIGGKESDLLPPVHIQCSGGNNSLLFYDVLRSNHLFFISANAMLALGLMKLYSSQEKFSLENLYNIITDSNYVGILSSGVVQRDGEIVSFDKIPNF